MAINLSSLKAGVRWPMRTRLGVMVAAWLMVSVPFVYLSFLIATGVALVWTAHRAFETCMIDPAWSPTDAATCAGMLACTAAWVLFLRPFWVRGRSHTATLEVRQLEQVDLFRTVEMAAVYAKAPMPAAVHLDAGGAVRLESMGRWGGVIRQRHRLVLGLSWVAMSEERRLVADITAALSQSPKGLAGRAYWLVRGISDWLDRATTPVAAVEAAEGVNLMIPKRPLPKRWWRNRWLVAGGRAFVWLTQRPLWIMTAFSKMVSAPALRAVVYAGDAAQVRLIGSAAFPELLMARRRILAALAEGAARVEEGLKTERLPDNLPHLVGREGEGMAKKSAASLPDLPTDAWTPAPTSRERRVAKQNAEAAIVEGGSATGLIQRFHELSRQLTQTFYQQDLGLNLSQFRLVSAGEARKKTEDSSGAALAIRTYFGGLAHANRALCGLVPCDGQSPTCGALKEQLEMAAEWMAKNGDRVRSVQKEWGLAWQRSRDLEMAHAFALAGLRLDSRDYGLNAHRPEIYREEIERQEMIMMHSDEALRSVEANLEKRFAAALGLMFCMEESVLPAAVADRLAALPTQAAAYEAMAQRLPVAWPLLNWVHAFDAMGVSEEESLMDGDDPQEGGSRTQALQYLVPLIVDHAQRLIGGLEGLRCPMAPGQTLEAYMHSGITESKASTDPMVRARQAIQITETFIETYQEVFGWLSQTAELVEEHLLPLVELSGMPGDVPPVGQSLSWQPETLAAPPAPSFETPSFAQPTPGSSAPGAPPPSMGTGMDQPVSQASVPTAMSAWEEAIARHSAAAN